MGTESHEPLNKLVAVESFKEFAKLVLPAGLGMIAAG